MSVPPVSLPISPVGAAIEERKLDLTKKNLGSASDSQGWQSQMQEAIRDPETLCEILQLPASLAAQSRKTLNELAPRGTLETTFPLFAPRSYVARIKPQSPQDPLLRQILPLPDENRSALGFVVDPVGDLDARQQPGLLQKYAGRALFVLTGKCAIHCRYCFRRHYPYGEEPRTWQEWKGPLEAVAQDESIHEVILSGGDPLTLSDRRLQNFFAACAEIPQIRRLRIHSRLPIMIPARVTERLLQSIRESRLTTYFVIHANHAQELNTEVWEALDKLRQAGAVLMNQTVLLRGINDQLATLIELCEQLCDHGVIPYYLHQLDPVQGAAHFEVPVATGLKLVRELRASLPGYAVPTYVREAPGALSKTPLSAHL